MSLGRSGLRWMRLGLGLGVLCAGVLLAVPFAAAQQNPSEPTGNKDSPNLKKEGSVEYPAAKGPAKPPPEPTEAERVKLDTDALLGFRHIEDDAPLRTADQNEDEHRAYNYTLAHAHKIPVEVLARHSLEEVPFANLIKPIRQDYLRKLIHVEGRLLRLRPMEPTESLQREDKIEKLYEGWLIPKDEQFPVCIVFTELPADLRLSKPKEILDQWVSFDGYFFKLLQYETGEKIGPNKYVWRKAPLLLGHSPQLQSPEQETGMSFGDLVPLIIALLLGVVGVALGLTLWFRRGDRAVRDTLAQAQSTNPFQ
jgi:hypothetical protein